MAFHRIERVADILIFNKQSVSGEKSALFWERVNGLSSVVETPFDASRNSSLLHFFNGLLKLYGAQRIGVHDEIDCGEWRRTAVIA